MTKVPEGSGTGSFLQGSNMAGVEISKDKSGKIVESKPARGGIYATCLSYHVDNKDTTQL